MRDLRRQRDSNSPSRIGLACSWCTFPTSTRRSPARRRHPQDYRKTARRVDSDLRTSGAGASGRGHRLRRRGRPRAHRHGRSRGVGAESLRGSRRVRGPGMPTRTEEWSLRPTSRRPSPCLPASRSRAFAVGGASAMGRRRPSRRCGAKAADLQRRDALGAYAARYRRRSDRRPARAPWFPPPCSERRAPSRQIQADRLAADRNERVRLCDRGRRRRAYCCSAAIGLVSWRALVAALAGTGGVLRSSTTDCSSSSTATGGRCRSFNSRGPGRRVHEQRDWSRPLSRARRALRSPRSSTRSCASARRRPRGEYLPGWLTLGPATVLVVHGDARGPGGVVRVAVGRRTPTWRLPDLRVGVQVRPRPHPDRRRSAWPRCCRPAGDVPGRAVSSEGGGATRTSAAS